MPLFLLSLPLSFKTFWRYLLILPVLAVGAFVLSLAGFIPVVGFVIPGTVSALCVLVGLRCALAARGRWNAPDLGQLLRTSLVFCIVNMIATWLIVTVAALGFLEIAIVLDWLGMPKEAVNHALAWIGGGAILLTLILLSLYYSAIAVPMTGAAAACTERGGNADPVFGFGTGMVSLTLVALVWLCGGRFLAFFGEVWVVFGMMATAIWAMANGEEVPWDFSLDLNSLMGSTLFMTWASSWFYATAVLAWERADERRRAALAAETQAKRVPVTDICALREARDGQRMSGCRQGGALRRPTSSKGRASHRSRRSGTSRRPTGTPRDPCRSRQSARSFPW